LKGQKMVPLEKRMDMFYLDADLMPLMIQENYLKTYEKRRRNDDNEVDMCAKAAELIALGDTMSNNWEVQSSAAVLGSIYPAFLSADESFKRPGFPTWLQKRGPTAKAERMVQDMHAKIRAVTTCTSQSLVTSNYHDVLYRRLLKPLAYGAAKECAEALFSTGLTKEFFTDQAPALRTPLHLEDNYKKIEGRVKQQMYQELQALIQAAKPAEPMKRKREDGAFNKKRKGGAEADGGEEEAPGDGGDAAGPDKKKRKAGKKKGGGNAAASLSSWKPVAEGADSQATESRKGGPLMVLKYVEGHTCAVRRKVHMKDLLNPWLLF